MKKDEIGKYFISNYSLLCKYALKICGKIGRPDKAQDIVHDVFIVLWSDHYLKMVEKNINSEDDLCRYIKKMIQRFSVSSHTNAWQSYHSPFCPIEFVEIDPERIITEPDIDTINNSEEIQQCKQHLFHTLLNDMKIAERNRQIYIFHCVKGLNFKDWEGPENLKKLNRVCYEINKALRERIKKYNNYLHREGGIFP